MTDQTSDLRDQIAEALMSWNERNANPQYATLRRPETVRQNAYSRADAVLAVLAARQATGQADTTAGICGSRSLPTYSGEVVRCVLHTGHVGQCQSAVDYPYVSWPNPSNGVWNRDAEAKPAAPVVGQPAAAPDTEARPPAYNAVYAHIRALGDHMPPDPVHRNAMIWRAVHAALNATPVGRCVSSHCVEGDHVLILDDAPAAGEAR